MTCKDCYHHDVCHLRISLNMDYDEVKDKPITEIEKRCEYFRTNHALLNCLTRYFLQNQKQKQN